MNGVHARDTSYVNKMYQDFETTTRISGTTCQGEQPLEKRLDGCILVTGPQPLLFEAVVCVGVQNTGGHTESNPRPPGEGISYSTVHRQLHRWLGCFEQCRSWATVRSSREQPAALGPVWCVTRRKLQCGVVACMCKVAVMVAMIMPVRCCTDVHG